MAGKPQLQWPDDDAWLRQIEAAGNLTEWCRQAGVSRGGAQSRARQRGLEDRIRQASSTKQLQPVEAAGPDEFAASVHALVKRRKRISVEALADELDCSPRRVREALEGLRANGYRVPEESGEVILQPVDPDKLNLHRLDPKLLDGDVLKIGVVSDTHLSSNEQALDELNLAYDYFADQGIREVWHAGDFTCGVGIFPQQHAEIFNHTFETQVDYLEAHYPRRDGIVTRGISGNHDIEGDFGKVGANPVVALANRREDVEFLGDYSAWLELPNGAWVHLLHGKGGMSYAYSYKAQKLVDGYPAGRKPALLIVGHWHVRGNFSARDVEVIFPGCFEWRSKFLQRLGLRPKVGFHVLTLTIGPDGSLVRFLPEWLSIYEGRVVGGTLANQGLEPDELAA